MDNTKLKPFNIEEAKAGKPVINGAGEDVRIICYDAKGKYPVIALIESEEDCFISWYNIDGAYYPHISLRDLYMKPQIKKGWVASWSEGQNRYTSGDVYDTVEDCREDYEEGYTYHEIEWEE